MRIMGVDPASGRSGIAVMDDETLLHSEQWEVTRALALPTNIAMFAAKVAILLNELEVEHIVIERIHTAQNMNTVRKIAYFEAGAMIAAAGRAHVEQLGISTARKKVLGDGGLNKLDAAGLVRIRFGDDLSLDECDAIVLALAATTD